MDSNEQGKKKKVLELYPIDYPFETLVTRVKDKKLILDPDFQRKYKWDKEGNEERTSKFIESCLMRIPIPACYFAENENSTHSVIDGVQRITTIKRFLNDEFSLESLTIFTELNGKRFSQLGDYRSELESTTIRCIILRKSNAKELVNEIFARLNKGAVELAPQEIRHAIYPGTFDALLTKLSQNEIIQKFKVSKQQRKKMDTKGEASSKKSLEGEETILRFFAFGKNLKLNDYNDNLHKFLDNFMARNQNLPTSEIEKLEKYFNDTLEKCIQVFGKDEVFSAKVSTLKTTKYRNPRSPQQGVTYYDLQMWSMQFYDLTTLIKYKSEIKNAFDSLCQNNEFSRMGGLQQKVNIMKRRDLWQEKLNQIEGLVQINYE